LLSPFPVRPAARMFVNASAEQPSSSVGTALDHSLFQLFFSSFHRTVDGFIPKLPRFEVSLPLPLCKRKSKCSPILPSGHPSIDHWCDRRPAFFFLSLTGDTFHRLILLLCGRIGVLAGFLLGRWFFLPSQSIDRPRPIAPAGSFKLFFSCSLRLSMNPCCPEFVVKLVTLLSASTPQILSIGLYMFFVFSVLSLPRPSFTTRLLAGSPSEVEERKPFFFFTSRKKIFVVKYKAFPFIPRAIAESPPFPPTLSVRFFLPSCSEDIQS